MAQVTDPVLLRELAREGINPADVDFDQDYASRSLGKRHSPYAKFYRGLSGNARGKQWVVVSGLSMVDCDGIKVDPRWVVSGNVYRTKVNVFDGLVNDIPGRVTLTVKNDDAVGRKKNDRLVYIPQLFLNGIEVPRPSSVLLPVDPLNPNYLENTIEWDYGVCKRRLRQIEGHILGSWVFPTNPGGDVRIKYNQVGSYRLKLGRYKINEDEELIPAQAFITDEYGQPRQYPFTVSDSATFYPDANPETTSVDGSVARQPGEDLSWANITGGAGTSAWDTSLADSPLWRNGTSAGTFQRLHRVVFLFDTSGLPDDVTISAATFSVHGAEYGKDDPDSNSPSLAVYASNPATNTALVAADYNIANWGATALSASISYGNYTLTGYNDFALNASGLALISKIDVSKFGLRFNYDVSGTPTSTTALAYTFFYMYFSEQGAGYKPKLVITYTLPSTTQGKASLNAAKLMAAGAI